eukprot:1931401-Prymnesium_polylepis.1
MRAARVAPVYDWCETSGLLPGICVNSGAKPTQRAPPTPAVKSARLRRRQGSVPSASQESLDAEVSAA